MGSRDRVQPSENTVCCLDRFREQYTTVESFGRFLDDRSANVRREIERQGACRDLDSPPRNRSADLLDGHIDFVVGSFERMSRSFSSFDHVLTHGYRDVSLFLAVEDIEEQSAIITRIQQGVRLNFFVGIAHLKPTSTDRIVATTSQLELSADITNSYVFTTPILSTNVGGGFVKDISVSVSEVLHHASNSTTKFATIQVIVSPSFVIDRGSDANGVIPAKSLVVSSGIEKTSSQVLTYPCVDLYQGASKDFIDNLNQQQSWCAIQDPICAAAGPLLVDTGGYIQFTFPLPDNAWEKNIIQTENSLLPVILFIDFMLVVYDKEGKKIMTSLQTQTDLRTVNILRRCTETKQLSSNILDIIEIDMFLGLAGNESSYEKSVVQNLDITRNGTRRAGPVVLQRNISSKASNIMTMLFKGDPALFENDFAKRYTLSVEDIFSLHFLNEQKKTLVEQLIADGRAFTTINMLANDANSRTVMKLEPTAELLSYCPLHAKRGVFGCNARREIKARSLDFETNSITSLNSQRSEWTDVKSTAGREDVHLAYMRAGLWSQLHLGDSKYANELGYNHSKLMNEKHSLNSRYRSGFMIAPTIPWRKTEIDAETERDDNMLDLAQHMITTILVSLDTNFGQEFEATVELTVPCILSLTRQQVIEHQILIAAAYAQGANLDVVNVFVDIDSVVQVSSEMDRRRNLQQTETPTRESITEFNIIAGFAIANEGNAMAESTLFTQAIQTANSLKTRLILQAVNTALARKIPFYIHTVSILDTRKTVKAAKSRLRCYDNEDWEIEVTESIGIDLGYQNNLKMIGFVSCHGRRVRLRNVDGTFTEPANLDMHTANAMNMRGPMQDTDWNMVSRENVLEAASARQRGWMWWDFCAAPPRIAVHSPQFLQAWEDIKTQAASQCCVCKASPRIHMEKTSYIHKYTWPLRLEHENIYDMYTQTLHPLHSSSQDMLPSVFKINPQIRNFRLEYGSSAAQFDFTDSAFLPPSIWDVDEAGRTLFPNCDDAHWVSSRLGCTMCPINTYRRADVAVYPNTAEAYKRGGLCTHCPPNAVTGYLRSTLIDCLCAKGYYKATQQTTSIDCVICPPNTYKDTNSNVLGGCTPCPNGLQSRSGSIDLGKCVRPISIGELDNLVHIYTTILGLVYFQTSVQPGWSAPRAIDQDQTMLCVLVTAAGVSLDCGSGVYHNVYAVSPVTFGTQPNRLRSISMNSTTSAQILSFHGPLDATSRLRIVLTPAIGVDFFVNNIDRVDYKGRVKHISLFPRPGYMGPSPPGFVEQILSGMRWVRGIVLTTTLRVRILNTDLSKQDAGDDIYMVNFISSRRLNTANSSIDWHWIICGRKTSTNSSAYAFCRHEPDPDNPTEQNYVNPDVLDGSITRLNGDMCCQSCFHDYDWLPDCRLQHENPHRINMYDNTIEWVPFLRTQPPNASGSFYLYTFFTSGQSAACQSHNCNEAAIYRNMRLHLLEKRTMAWDNSIDFLPGTRFAYRIPITTYTSLPLYKNMLGFVAMNRIPRTVEEGIHVPYTLDRIYAGHTCRPTNANSIACTSPDTSITDTSSTTTALDNMYTPDMEDWIEKTPIMPYVYPDAYAKTFEINYCCKVTTPKFVRLTSAFCMNVSVFVSFVIMYAETS